jgi:sugar lactone lactonase YvrE
MNYTLRSAALAAAPIFAAVLTACGGGAATTPTAGQLSAASRPAMTSGGASSTCMSSPCIYVTNTKPARNASVTVYPIMAKGNAAPVTEISGAATGLIDPTGIALDAQHNIYVSNVVSGSSTISEINVFPAGSSGNAAPVQTIGGSATLLAYANAIAVDANQNIYIANEGISGSDSSVNVYAAGANGNVAPIRMIVGANTGLNDPNGIAVDPSGKIYVTNEFAHSVTVYAAGANGNATPVQTIAGHNTRINMPTGIALDSSLNVYVNEFKVGEMTVFAPGANGNVNPLWRLYGTDSKLHKPRGIALDSTGRVYVANLKTSTITVYAAGASGDTKPVQTIGGPRTKIHSVQGVAVL